MIESPLSQFANRVALAEEAYGEYMKSGRTFQYASRLRTHNCAIREMLLTASHLLPTELRVDADDLIFHIDTWLTLWKELERAISPQAEDEFVFVNPVPFPKHSVARLLNWSSHNVVKRS